MQVKPVSAFYDNYIWMVINENKQVLSVDPGEAKPVLKFLEEENLNLNAILLTHHHFDHIDGTSELVKRNPRVKVYGPKDARIPLITQELTEGMILKINDCEFQILATPGHTSTHISYYEPQQGWLFCGDTLFSAGCGRVFDGSIEELYESLQKLKNLPNETQVFCAHEYTRANLRFAATVEPTNLNIRNYAQRLISKLNQCSLPSSIAMEKEINPFFRSDTKPAQDFAKQKGSKDCDPLSVFKQIRAEKDRF